MTGTESILITGGNRPESRRLLQEALTLLGERAGTVTAVSQVCTSKAWGFESDDFVNQAVVLRTTLTPHQLLDAVQSVERDLGRDRTAEAGEKSATGQRYASRPIDIDILYYGELTVSDQRLTIPHPRIAERAFVLRPLCQVAAEKINPANGLSNALMLAQLTISNE